MISNGTVKRLTMSWYILTIFALLLVEIILKFISAPVVADDLSRNNAFFPTPLNNTAKLATQGSATPTLCDQVLEIKAWEGSANYSYQTSTSGSTPIYYQSVSLSGSASFTSHVPNSITRSRSEYFNNQGQFLEHRTNWGLLTSSGTGTVSDSASATVIDKEKYKDVFDYTSSSFGNENITDYISGSIVLRQEPGGCFIELILQPTISITSNFYSSQFSNTYTAKAPPGVATIIQPAPPIGDKLELKGSLHIPIISYQQTLLNEEINVSSFIASGGAAEAGIYSSLKSQNPGTGSNEFATVNWSFTPVYEKLGLEFLTQPADASPNEPFKTQPVVRILNEEHEVDTLFNGPPISVALLQGVGTSGAALSGNTSKDVINGVATFDNLAIDKGGTGWFGYALKAEVVGRPDIYFATTDYFNVGPITKLSFTTQPTGAFPNKPFKVQPVIQVLNENNQVYTSAAGEVGLLIKTGSGTSGAVLQGTVRTPIVEGVATFNDIGIDKAGENYVLEAYVVFRPDITMATSNLFNVSKLIFATQPAGATVNKPFKTQPVVQLFNDQNQVDTTFNGPISLAIKSGTGIEGAMLKGKAQVNAVSGVATFTDLAIDKAGKAYVLEASIADMPNIAKVESNSINVIQSAKLSFATQPAGAFPNKLFKTQPVVQVLNDQNQVDTSFTGEVELNIKSGTGTSGALMAGLNRVPIVQGVATFNDLGIDKIGKGYIFQASVVNMPDISKVESNPFRVGITLKIVNVDPIQVVKDAKLADNKPIALVKDKPMIVRVGVYVADFAAETDFLQNLQFELSLGFNPIASNTADLIYDPQKDKNLVSYDFFVIPANFEITNLTVKVDPKDLLSEANPADKMKTIPIKIYQTNSLTVAFVPVQCGTPLEHYDNTVFDAGETTKGIFPIAPSNYKSYKLTTSECNTLKSKLDFNSIWEIGKITTAGMADRVIAVVQNFTFDQMLINQKIQENPDGITLGFTAACNYSYKTVYVRDGIGFAVVHELMHTYGIEDYGASGSSNCPKVSNSSMTNGYWVDKKQVFNASNIMDGKALGNPIWITTDDYVYLFNRFLLGPQDPEILLVAGAIDKTDHVEWSPLYRLPSGILDDGDNGPYSIQVLDKEGRILYNRPFNVQFQLLTDPASNTDTQSSPFTFAVAYPTGATSVQLVKNDQVLSKYSISGKLLRDAVLSIPDSGFVKKPSESRNLLLDKIETFEKLLTDNNLNWAGNLLKDDIRKQLTELLIDNYPTTSVLELTKPKILELVDVLLPKLESKPPATNLSALPNPNSKGWNKSDVTLTLTAKDRDGGSSIKTITYSASGAQLIPSTTVSGGSASIKLTVEGQTSITYYATDNTGNAETPKTFTVKLDKTAPEATIQFDPGSKDLIVVGRDVLSGVPETVISPTSVTPINWGDSDKENDDKGGKTELRHYLVTDLAGNTLELSVKVKRAGKEIKARILNLQYNGGSLVNTSKNEFSFEWAVGKDGSLQELEQTMQIGNEHDQQRVEANYEGKKNQTIIKEGGTRGETKVVKTGLVLLRITSDKGKMAINY